MLLQERKDLISLNTRFLPSLIIYLTAMHFEDAIVALEV